MRLIIWDFDGTLAYREGGMWSATLAEVVNASGLRGRQWQAGDFAPHLAQGFPWHQPGDVHTHISDADHWWRELGPLLAGAIQAATGLPQADAVGLLPEVRHAYTDASRWRVFPDVLACLEQLSAAGWTHRILSNHVPELEALVIELGLRPHFEEVWNSAWSGYEKPHPGAYRAALGGLPAEGAWMIGDSVEADVLGAVAHGLRGVLVRKASDQVKHAMPNLGSLPDLIGAGP